MLTGGIFVLDSSNAPFWCLHGPDVTSSWCHNCIFVFVLAGTLLRLIHCISKLHPGFNVLSMLNNCISMHGPGRQSRDAHNLHIHACPGSSPPDAQNLTIWCLVLLARTLFVMLPDGVSKLRYDFILRPKLFLLQRWWTFHIKHKFPTEFLNITGLQRNVSKCQNLLVWNCLFWWHMGFKVQISRKTSSFTREK